MHRPSAGDISVMCLRLVFVWAVSFSNLHIEARPVCISVRNGKYYLFDRSTTPSLHDAKDCLQSHLPSRDLTRLLTRLPAEDSAPSNLAGAPTCLKRAPPTSRLPPQRPRPRRSTASTSGTTNNTNAYLRVAPNELRHGVPQLASGLRSRSR